MESEVVESGGDHDSIRRSYDEIAGEYLDHFRDELVYKPLDRALLGSVIEQSDLRFPIADVGCGPGHVAAWLSRHGALAVGIDLSPGMIDVGRRRYGDVEFRQGDLLSLPARDDEFAAVVALYCIIHLVYEELHPAFEEIRRMLRPGGLLLVSFHVGSEVRHLSDWWGRSVDLDFRFYEPEQVVELLVEAGLEVDAQLVRVNYPQEVETRRAYVLARRPIS